MSLPHMAAAWASDLPPTDRLVLLALADWADKAGRCWPSIPQLASKTGIHERTVRLAVSRLESGGHLTRQSIIGKGTRYRLTKRADPTPGAAPAPGVAPTPGVTPAPGVAPGTPGAAPTNTPAIPQERNKASPSPSTRAPRNAVEALPDLPAGASDRQWADYVAMRVDMARADKRRPWTPTIARKAIEKLHALASNGHDPGAVLDQSVLNIWRGLFPVKGDAHGRIMERPGAPAPSIRGSRPDPALDLLYAARAAEEAERAGGCREDDRGTWPALPPYGSD